MNKAEFILHYSMLCHFSFYIKMNCSTNPEDETRRQDEKEKARIREKDLRDLKECSAKLDSIINRIVEHQNK